MSTGRILGGEHAASVSYQGFFDSSIKDAIKAALIRPHDETVGSRARKYLPWWA